MIDKTYICTFSQDATDVIAEYGMGIELNEICISEYLDEDCFDNTVETMRKDIEESGAKNVIMHGPFTEIIPASIDHRAVDMGLARLEEAYEACKRLGINRMVVHSGYLPLLYFKEWHHEKSVFFWKKFMEGKEDFTIYIENVFDDEPLMMKTLIDELDDPRIKVCLDVGHASAVTLPEYDVYTWIEILGKRIGHFHLHNNDGKKDLHAPVFEGILDMDRILKTIDRCCGEDVTLTIESRVCRESAKWMAEYRK